MECKKCKKDLSEGFTDEEVIVWSNKPNEPRVPFAVVCNDCREKDKLERLLNQRNKINRQISTLKKAIPKLICEQCKNMIIDKPLKMWEDKEIYYCKKCFDLVNECFEKGH